VDLVDPADLPRLYAILDIDLTRARGLDPLAVLDDWLEAGVRLVQLRAKALASGSLLTLADQAQARVHAAGGRLIINDRADVARMSGAAGVHVGQEDLSPRGARTVVGQSALVGLSTHSPAQLDAALKEPISYLAVGPVFWTPTKRQACEPVGLDGVRLATTACRSLGLPVVAIGGISLATAGSVLDAGARSVAVIADLLVGDPGGRARAFLAAVG
jgi:thiamine-phosphate pyrophosphorylase